VFKLAPEDLPLSQIIILLQQPPMPPAPPEGINPENGPLLDEGMIPEDLPPDALAAAESAPESEADNIPLP